jgi:chromosome segregation protein
VRRLGVADAAELGPALDRLDRREALEGERSELTRDLAAIADGFDEATLRLEQDGLDVDAAPAQIERLELRQKALLGEIGEASAKLRQAENDREALARGRDAVGAARDRAEAAAELTNIAERWIAQAAAAELAKRAIERRRAAIEDPLVARAGALFSIATAQSFVGLGADYGKADEPILVAVRANGKRVEIEGLSEGARDQLFLALRLALLERRAAEPLPFIGDDLLASFDESRTQRTLTLLAEFGRSRQVSLFTHHLHVAELAAAAGDPAIEVLRI